MVNGERVSAPAVWRGVVFAVGIGYVAAGLLLWLTQVVRGEPVTAILLDQLLLIGIGAVLAYGGHWLAGSAIRPTHYRQIAGWSLGGLGFMLGIVLLYYVNPVTTVTDPGRAIPLLSGFGAIAGFGLGTHRARAAELQHTKEQLERAVTELEVSNGRLEQFGRAISHDLKQPLRTMTVNLEFIEMGGGNDLDADEREMLADAIGSATRMRKMVDGLLAYAQIDAEVESFERVDVEAVCEDVLADLKALIEERDAEVTIGSLPTIQGNSEQLYQVFLNLVENAIKYSEETPRVHVDSELTPTGWRISVTDNGIGIADDEEDDIFGLFKRSHRVAEYEGIGLGLAMCKGIVERHGGDIGVESKPGDGSTFFVNLPSFAKPHIGASPARAGRVLEPGVTPD